MLRVLIADDDPVTRESLAKVLHHRGELFVSSVVSDGYAALAAVTQCVVDVALLDVNMPGIDGIETARRMQELRPNTAVIILTAFERDDFLGRALVAGVRGFLTKDAPVNEIADAIQAVHGGGTVMSLRPTIMLAQSYRDHFMRRSEEKEFVAAVLALPPSLKEVFELLTAVTTNRQIAEITGLAPSTVREYVSEVLRRTGCRSRGEVAVRAVSAGLDAARTGVTRN